MRVPRGSTAPVRESSATSRRDPNASPPTGLTEAISLPRRARGRRPPPPRCTACTTAPVTRSIRSSGRSRAGLAGSSFNATQRTSALAATGPGCPGPGGWRSSLESSPSSGIACREHKRANSRREHRRDDHDEPEPAARRCARGRRGAGHAFMIHPGARGFHRTRTNFRENPEPLRRGVRRFQVCASAC